MTLSGAGIVGSQMNYELKEFDRNRCWFFRGTTLEFVWRDWGNLRKPSVRTAWALCTYRIRVMTITLTPTY
jgi:hypothetical protein